MKTYRIIFRCLSGLLFLALLGGCEKEGLLEYTENPGVYFDGTERSYSFFDHPGKTLDTLNLPVLITGNSRDYDRTIRVEVVDDTNTTAGQDMYELLNGYVKSGEFQGIVPVVFKYNDLLEHEIRKLKIRIAESEDFKEPDLGQKQCLIHLTAKIIKPDNWNSWLLYYFGEAYSTGWWKFIMKVTERNSLPYYPTHPDKETWWMSADELLANYWKVKNALKEYNADPANNPPLLHDDGPYAGQKVVMPEL